MDDPAGDEETAGDGQNGVKDGQIVVSGDANAAQKKATTETEKKIPDDKRTTTPYMTKYERARVLGTRALQIR